MISTFGIIWQVWNKYSTLRSICLIFGLDFISAFNSTQKFWYDFAIGKYEYEKYKYVYLTLFCHCHVTFFLINYLFHLSLNLAEVHLVMIVLFEIYICCIFFFITFINYYAIEFSYIIYFFQSFQSGKCSRNRLQRWWNFFVFDYTFSLSLNQYPCVFIFLVGNDDASIAFNFVLTTYTKNLCRKNLSTSWIYRYEQWFKLSGFCSYWA